jgi:hypothetical protein
MFVLPVFAMTMFVLTMDQMLGVADCRSPELIDQVDYLSGSQQDWRPQTARCLHWSLRRCRP